MCVLFSCFKMKVPRSPLPGKSLEQAWKASEAEVSRACRERASARSSRSKARRERRRWRWRRWWRRAFLPEARPPPEVGSQGPTGLRGSGLALGVNGVQQHSRGEGIDAQSKLYKSTVLQHLGFSSNANFYRFFFFFCFPLIFLLLYRYFKRLLFKILYNYYDFKRGKS